MEEDIKLLKDETNTLGLFFKCSGMGCYKKALENILNELDRLKKENEELIEVKISANSHNIIENLQKENKDLQEYNKNVSDRFIECKKDSITKQVIRDKIEELSEDLEIMKVDAMYGRYKDYGSKLSFDKKFSYKYGMHDVLQELLESEENK